MCWGPELRMGAALIEHALIASAAAAAGAGAGVEFPRSRGRRQEISFKAFNSRPSPRQDKRVKLC